MPIPENEYLTVSERPAWELLDRLGAVHPRFAHYSFRGACGLEPCPATPTVVVVVARIGGCHRAAARPGSADGPAHRLRLQCRQPELGHSRVVVGHRALHEEDRAEDRRRRRQRWGSGVTTRPGASTRAALFAKPATTDRPRAPCTSGWTCSSARARRCSRRSTAWCTASPTTPTRSTTARRSSSNTRRGLAGRPSTRCTGTWRRDRSPRSPWASPFAREAVIARIGTTAENGGWPPHLHFQLITDLLDRHGDFPGVADPGRAPRVAESRTGPEPHRPDSRRVSAPGRNRPATTFLPPAASTSAHRSASPTAARSPSSAAGCSTCTTPRAARIWTRSTTFRTSATVTRASSRRAGGRWRC